MTVITHLTRGLAAAALSLVAVCASAQAVVDIQKPFEPVSGHAGKDVVWVPTPQATVAWLLDRTSVTTYSVVITIASGTCNAVISAARRGATSTGVEFSTDMVSLAWRTATPAGVCAWATCVQGGVFVVMPSEATVISLFL